LIVVSVSAGHPRSAAYGRPSPLGPQWEELGFRQLGWRLLPLRGFLGITFLYASLQKLANPNYFRASSPSSFVSQTKALESRSPISPLLHLALHAPGPFALLIALGELAVALGILAGLWTRLAAVGGMLLSLTFFLTVSWSTTPYFYGSDIVFVFAWSVFAMCGAGGVLCLDAWIASRAQASPSYGPGSVDLARRHLLVGARSATLLALFGGVLGGMTALIGRASGGTKHGARAALTVDPTAPIPSASPHHKHHQQAAPPGVAAPSNAPAPSGTALAPASAVPVGEGRTFTDPSSGQPAWIIRPAASQVRAFTATCTHAGCTVQYDSSNDQFVCPCHGGTYSASTGAVTGGPPPAPLTQIPARLVNGEIRVD
jgi:thiosulfate dehydrogenase [quinone] large subunit